MVTLIEYVEQFGDVPFEESPFNEVDSLALCQLTYCVFAETASGRDARRECRRLFDSMACSRRFGDVRLTAFEERFDPVAHESSRRSRRSCPTERRTWRFAAPTTTSPVGARTS